MNGPRKRPLPPPSTRAPGIAAAIIALAAAGCGATGPYDLAPEPAARADRIVPSWRVDPDEAAADLPPLDDRAGLDTYLAHGAARNAGLRASFETWLSALEVAPQASALPDPRLTFTYFIEELQTRTGPQEDRFSLTQTIPWIGKLVARNDLAEQRAEVLWRKVEARRLEVSCEIKRAYADYAWLARVVRISEDMLSLLKQLEPVIQRKLEGGGAQHDILRLQVEVGKLENEVETLRKLRPVLSARLNAAMNRRDGGLLPWPPQAEPVPIAVTPADLANRAQRGNPDLDALRQQILTEERRIDLANQEGLPDFGLGVEYMRTGRAIMRGTPGSGNDPIAVMASVTLPIWRGKYVAAIREAEAARRAAQQALREEENALIARVERAAYALDEAARQIALYRDTLLPRTRQALDVTRTAYVAGRATLLDVIDSERSLLDFEKAFWRAVANHEQAIADLETLCGGELR
jgi:outer membrane protein TolC